MRITSTIARRDNDHAVFHGCFDWHSAVHGHWALFRIARVGAGSEGAAAADLSLSVEGLTAEAEFLKKNPYFEMPYGRAWFLRLAVEQARWSSENGGGDPERLLVMADAVAESVLDFYDDYLPTPAARNYNSASWALAQLYDYLDFVGDARGLKRVRNHIETRFLGPGMGFSPDAGVPEFFSPFGNWVYLLTKTRTPDELARFLRRHPITNADLAPVGKLLPWPHRPSEEYKPFAHQFGMNWSRAWSLAALSRAAPEARVRKRFSKAFRAHVVEGLRQDAVHKDDFGRYGHWVPQFAVYAITAGLIR